MWFFVVCAAVAAALTVGVVVGRLDGGLGKATSSLAHVPLPWEGRLTDDQIAAVRFDIGLRGYRMGQVDDVIDRLRDELDTQRQRLAELERDLTPSVGFAPPSLDEPVLAGDVGSPDGVSSRDGVGSPDRVGDPEGSALRPEWH